MPGAARHGGLGHRLGQRCDDASVVTKQEDACIRAQRARALRCRHARLGRAPRSAHARSAPVPLLHPRNSNIDGLTARIHPTASLRRRRRSLGRLIAPPGRLGRDTKVRRNGPRTTPPLLLPSNARAIWYPSRTIAPRPHRAWVARFSRRSLLDARRRPRRSVRVRDDGSLGPWSSGSGPRSCTRPGPQPPPRPLRRSTPAGRPNREAGASYAVTNGVIAVPDRRPGLYLTWRRQQGRGARARARRAALRRRAPRAERAGRGRARAARGPPRAIHSASSRDSTNRATASR